MGIGDTLWLEINILITLKDNNSNNNINYSGAQNLGTVITLLNILPSGVDTGAIKNFNILILNGSKFHQTTDSLSNEIIICNEELGYYNLKVMLVAKKVGNYVLTISNASGVYRKSDNCLKAFYEIDFSKY